MAVEMVEILKNNILIKKRYSNQYINIKFIKKK